MRYLLIVVLSLAGMVGEAQGLIAIRDDAPDSQHVMMGSRYPFVVRVGADGGDGTLIAPEWVLTAAHVAEGMARRSGGGFKVFVDGQTEGYAVRQVILHPDFQPMGPGDIALVRLARAVEGVSPIGIYRRRDEKGKLITVVGHGDTKRGSGGPWVRDGVLRGATNLVDEVNDNHIIFDFDDPDHATELEGTAGPGDSGGPAFIAIDGRPFIAGVSSLGQPGRNGPGTYQAREHYVRVSSHATWIDSMLSNPPEGALVNAPVRDPESDMRRSGRPGPGGPPPGVVVLQEIGLMVQDRDGKVRMVGRVDQAYPVSLLDGGIRPPAVVTMLDGRPVKSARDLKARFDALVQGATFMLEFDQGGKTQRFELTK